ncbi:hypothetical protein [Paracoccus sp. (in: a-proteobacteria)]|uniref:hypothetical protein n=1 Tax=Paracoccus sp. TaxID=267 RepID=UPI00272CE1B0|nr:hypothetical protein [Paracoccus sp. (in: a-proteobacteria)]
MLIDATPADQARLIVNKRGIPYQHENYLGDAVSQWRDSLKLRRELRLYDARGPLRPGCLRLGQS